ncbi:MAG: hypothetical protein F6K37_32245 [Moorea sp. SIO4E2]|uniref:hypothetical protein n=1 Tax=Moorena sp. SIO4E2 TaxID=2607826 RepID=UPI0013BD5A12|nr:hypothetical protein [Moorena sp. SIO4E2]NEQ10432.1 hypothetical protein [Moorena sp. SIO4E2]
MGVDSVTLYPFALLPCVLFSLFPLPAVELASCQWLGNRLDASGWGIGLMPVSISIE